MNEPGLDVGSLTDYSVADFVVNLNLLSQDAVEGELGREMADFRELAVVEFVAVVAVQAAFG